MTRWQLPLIQAGITTMLVCLLMKAQEPERFVIGVFLMLYSVGLFAIQIRRSYESK